MAINIGNKKLKTLHKGDALITRIFKGDELVYQDIEALYSFKFTIDTRNNIYGGQSATDKNFSISIGNVKGASVQILIDWGDGTSGTYYRSTNNANAYHAYASPGIYQVSIMPLNFSYGVPKPGWLSGIAGNEKIISIDKKYPEGSYIVARGYDDTLDYTFSTTFRSFASNGYFLSSVPSKLFDNAIFYEATGNTSYASLFEGAFNNYGRYTYLSPKNLATKLFSLIGDGSNITDFHNMFTSAFVGSGLTRQEAEGIFDFLDTSSGVDFSYMFQQCFANWNTGAQPFAMNWDTIPADLFSNLDTTNGENFNSMFSSTFSNNGTSTTTGTIPAGLFDFLKTSNGTNFSSMFSGCFSYCFPNSTSATIPAGLFDSLDTSNGTNFGSMFYSTFNSFAPKSTTGTIPSGLFGSLDTTSGTNFVSMFERAFYSAFPKSTTASIPSGLFDHINMTGATSAQNMFAYCFNSFVDNTSRTNNFVIPSGLFSSLNTQNCTNFSGMFQDVFQSIHVNSTADVVLPEHLFDVDTTNGVNFSNMFSWALYYTHCHSIPATLFSSLDTTNGNSFQGMFNACFGQSRFSTIPATLFASLDTSNGTNLASMFSRTFELLPLTAIPATLFSSINTSNATSTSSMFDSCFERSGVLNTILPIPDTLFSSIDVSNVPNVSGMFQRTFGSVYCKTYPTGIFGGIDLSPINGTPKNVSGIFTTTFYYDGISAYARGQGDWIMADVFDGMTDFSWATAANASSALRSMFSFSRNSADLTIGSASTILQHFNFIPDARTYMFMDRVNLTDYATINDNWK